MTKDHVIYNTADKPITFTVIEKNYHIYSVSHYVSPNDGICAITYPAAAAELKRQVDEEKTT